MLLMRIGAQLTTADGETTSHLMGTFYRTIRLLENGIKPIYVFDGKPPDMKSGELTKRTERREEAQRQLDKATEAGEQAEVDKFNRRLVRVTKQHNEEARQLLKLMGVPYIEAPCEAEAQCAAMVKSGKIYATATEDMDALTFGTSTLLRHLTFSEARKMPVQEFSYEKVLQGMEFSQSQVRILFKNIWSYIIVHFLYYFQFIDLCILLGCDYCESIRGIGPKRAIELIRQFENIETILKNIDTNKYVVPENWNYQAARELFLNPDVADPETIDVRLCNRLAKQINKCYRFFYQLKWTDPDEEGLVEFMCGNRQFNEERIRNGAKKIMKTRTTSTQGRLDSFFKILPSSPSTPIGKRKADEKKGSVNKKIKGNGGTPRGRKPK